MILCLVMDAEGRPVCTEMWPGNTADVSVLLPVVDRLRGRFGIGRVCVVADRGMISEATIAGLEERGLEYVLGARERSDSLVRDVVLADERAFTPLLVTRAAGQETQLFAKEVLVAGRRYIVCRNEAEADKDRADRQAIVAALEQQLQRGDKSLIGNSAYRRYLRRIRAQQADGAAITPPAPAFEFDVGKLADEAKFDGIFVLRTNSRISPLLAMLRYRDLLRVEQLFRAAKSALRTRPIFHSSDAAIRGHVFCSFLALVLQKELADRVGKIGLQLEWDDVRRDLDRLQHATIKQEGKSWELRTEATGAAAGVFKALRLALPPRVRPLGQSPPTQPAAAPKRRGRPRRSATRP
jgi:transposase